MGTTNQYYLHAILLPGTTWVKELTDVTPSANVELLTGYAGAATAPSFRGAQSASPDVRFTTPEVKTVLDKCLDVNNQLVPADYSSGNVDLYYRKATNFGGRVAIASASHLVLRLRRSMMVVERIEARQGQAATLTVRLVPTFDGTNIPVVGIGSQTIASCVNVASEYTLGPVKLNGVSVDGVQGWSLDEGIDPNVKASDGDVYPSFTGLRRGNPILAVDTPNLDLWQTHGVTGTELTAVAAYLRKRQAHQSANYADASEVHVKLSHNCNPCGMVYVRQHQGGIQDEAQLGLDCALDISGDATKLHPLVVATTSAIT